MDKKIVVGLVAAIAVIVIGICLWQGLQAKNKVAGNANQPVSQTYGNHQGSRGNRTRNNFTAATGTVASVGEKSITVNLDKGGSAIAFYSESTSVMKTTKLAAADLAVGQYVVANGSKAYDGSITASTVMVRLVGDSLSNMPQGAPTIQKTDDSANDQKATGAADTANTTGKTGDSSRGFVNGEITAIDGSKITIKLPDGSANTIVLADDARITKSEEATIKDVIEGVTVSVRGTNGSNGSIIAQTITIGEAGMFISDGAAREGSMPPSGQPSMDQSGPVPAQLPQPN